MSYKSTPEAWKMDGLELSVDQKLNDVYDIASTAAAGALPSVSSGDNGKALLVKSGKWQKASIPSQLPTVSADDNGDVLTVVQGAWAKAAPSGGSGAFEVHFSVEWNQQTQTYDATSDKTYSEINTAFTANKTIYAWMNLFDTEYFAVSYGLSDSQFNFYFIDETQPATYWRLIIEVDSESVSTDTLLLPRSVYSPVVGEAGYALDSDTLNLYFDTINGDALFYINISGGGWHNGQATFVFSAYYDGYCFAGPPDAIGYTAVIDNDTGVITVTAPNS